MKIVTRCDWVGNDELYKAYHDEEWGVPVLDSKLLFKHLCLEGQQAGLSWITVLKKRRDYQDLFYQFDPDKIVDMNLEEIETLSQDKRIIRSKNKIQAIVTNAQAYLTIENKMPFTEFLWQFTDHKTIVNCWNNIQDIPTSTEESKSMSKALKKEGFKYVGETICYAFMQAVGMVNDHIVTCDCYEKTKALARV